jgi:uncharacterized cupin superfamily protein
MRVNETSLDWTEVERGDAHFRRKQLAAAAGGEELGASLFELPPDGASFPYHYHTGNEEAIYVLAGTGTLRLDGDEQSLEPGDYVALPAGSDSAHRLRNDGSEPFRYLIVSTMREPDVMAYPDDEKVGFVAGAPPGGDSEARTLEGYYREGTEVDYWEESEE